MKKATPFIILRAKGRGFSVIPAGKTRAQAQTTLTHLTDTRSAASGVYSVYQVQPVRWQTVTTLEWGAKRGRPPKDTAVAVKKPKKKAPAAPAKRTQKPKKAPKVPRKARSATADLPKAIQERIAAGVGANGGSTTA